MKRVALIGMPNTGKSTLFNKISGSSAKVGNWPGVTVDLLSVKTMFGGELIELIDLPGIYGLSGYSEDEKVVADFIKNNQIDHIFYVANSAQLDRQLELMLELKKFNIPLTLVANMIDEAKAFGIEIDFKLLEQCLQTEIIPISAKYGQGFEKLHQKPKKNLPQKKQIIELDQVVKKTIHYPARLNNQNTKKLDALFLNPAFGLPIFLYYFWGLSVCFLSRSTYSRMDEQLLLSHTRKLSYSAFKPFKQHAAKFYHRWSLCWFNYGGCFCAYYHFIFFHYDHYRGQRLFLQSSFFNG